MARTTIDCSWGWRCFPPELSLIMSWWWMWHSYRMLTPGLVWEVTVCVCWNPLNQYLKIWSSFPFKLRQFWLMDSLVLKSHALFVQFSFASSLSWAHNVLKLWNVNLFKQKKLFQCGLLKWTWNGFYFDICDIVLMWS